MMKRLIGIFLFLCLLFSLTGCAGLRQPEPTEPLPEKAWVFFSYGRCRITNAEGQKIVFGIDDEQTDMEVFDTQLAGEEIVTWRKQVPGSASFTLVAPSADYDLYHEFWVSGGIYSGGAGGRGIQETTVDRTGKVTVSGKNMELDITIDNQADDSSIIFISGTAQERASAEPNEKGAILSGMTGTGKIAVHGSDNDCEISYTFTGEAVEIDVVSQPGEILITPRK